MHGADGTDDWRVVCDGATAFFPTASFEWSEAFIDAIGRVDGVEEHHGRRTHGPRFGALEIAAGHGIYAYDAYLIACAKQYRLPLLTLDRDLMNVARDSGIDLIEVRS